ncbi:aminopeptidase N [Acidocella sp.]|uniref:aminopeptidase N n=1 Tax=Acidocella sp. TaxID=50710 RepID=UPI0026319723|nr:aminopeptidase N [Acidocella sp.]
MADGQTPPRTPVKLADYSPPAYKVEHVSLDFELDPQVTIVKARLELRRNAPGLLKLDGSKLELLSIYLNGEALGDNGYALDDETLTIHEAPDVAVLETSVRINPTANTELSGLYTSGSGFFTQCEPEGFRKITYFPDRPDVMARYRVRMRADANKFPTLLSNGNLLASGIENDKAYAEWEDPHPKPSYLFALVAADLVCLKDEFTTSSGRRVELGIWVERGDEIRCAHAMSALKRAMKWDEETFGLEYDLDIFNIAAVSDFNAGAMENKGLNIFNTAYVLADSETATDTDFQNVERVIAHEYFHNWTGDRVTCRDWFQLSLKEGLTVFRDQEYMADQFSAAVKRIADVRLLRATQFRDDAGPLAHPVRPTSYLEINNFYTTTIYEKGAELVRMYRTIIGPQAFRRGISAYISKNDNSAATVEDFWAAMQSVTDLDLKQLMLWYEQAGTPEITFTEQWDETAKTFTLTLRQATAPTPGQKEKQPMLIPVAMGLLDKTGTDMHAETLLLREAKQSFTFALPHQPEAVSLFRHFSAPIKLKGQSRERLAFLAAHDSDSFNRWDALQQYATAILLDNIAAYQAGLSFTLDMGLKEAIAATLRDAAQDPAFAAEALALPMETLLADEMQIVDPDAIHAVRQAARQALGQALTPEFQAAYEAFGNAAPDDLSGPAMGARALRNAALGYLTAATGPALAAAQFARAGNMTDKLAALTNLVDEPSAARDKALETFYGQWANTKLVLDKWFAVQARGSAADTLSRVQALSTHQAMDVRNPNRVRALIGTFTANPAKFHDKSGDGYKLLADFVLRLDETNPQIAARLVTALGLWRRFDAKRQNLMKTELERILARKHLSRNTYELAAKALA